ncbi:MAG: FeoB-associated Cys-rich membrane protein, partial [Oscillospiraceae bacterium]|nr:FeoB-associated Cys-rich membrane protein [Oscillospiraceae bacterium]
WSSSGSAAWRGSRRSPFTNCSGALTMWITVLCLVLLAVWVFLAIRAVRRGRGGCGGSCADCPKNCGKKP